MLLSHKERTEVGEAQRKAIWQGRVRIYLKGITCMGILSVCMSLHHLELDIGAGN